MKSAGGFGRLYTTELDGAKWFGVLDDDMFRENAMSLSACLEFRELLGSCSTGEDDIAVRAQETARVC